MREGPLSELFRSTDPSVTPIDRGEAPEPERRPAGEGANYVAVIRVVGVGGAGCNAVNRMIEAGLRGVEFVAINTDRQALEESEADVRIPVGMELTRGLGTGGDLALGEQALRESEEQVRRALRGSDLVFIAAGEGGGTGSGGPRGREDRPRARRPDRRRRHPPVRLRGQPPHPHRRRGPRAPPGRRGHGHHHPATTA